MKNELTQFENRSDDWLAKERILEDRVSVWDFDEAKKIKEEHHQKHEEYEKKTKELHSQIQEQQEDNRSTKIGLIIGAVSIAVAVALITVLVIPNILISTGNNHFRIHTELLPVVAYFVFMFVLITNKKKEK